MRVALMLALLLFTQPLLAAKVYKWVDANGTVHYSSEPPAQTIPVETLDTTERRPASQNPETELGAEPEPGGPPAASALGDKFAENCRIAKLNVDTLKSPALITERDPETGERVGIDGAERARRLAQAENEARLYCK